MWHIFLIGLAVGIGAAAMPGPINVEVVRRTFAYGARIAIAFGFGAIVADLLYLTAISQGAVALVTSLPDNGKALMLIVGAALLLYVGIRVLRLKPIEISDAEREAIANAHTPRPLRNSNKSPLRSFVLGFLLTITSPSTIIYWGVVSFGVVHHAKANHLVTASLVAGVAMACTAWVIGATYVTSHFHRRISMRSYLFVERALGITLLVFAALSIAESIVLLTR